MAGVARFTTLIGLEQYMSQYPPAWYFLLMLVSIFGVLTWILDKFTQFDNLKKITAITGSISMVGLVYVTYTMDGA
ncbi:MAG: hypothetical protein VW862_05270 [Euryarchaeota archaeon]